MGQTSLSKQLAWFRSCGTVGVGRQADRVPTQRGGRVGRRGATGKVCRALEGKFILYLFLKMDTLGVPG